MLTIPPQQKRASLAAVVVAVWFVLTLVVGTSFDYAMLTALHLTLVFVTLEIVGGWTTPVGLCVMSLSVQGPLLAHAIKLASGGALDDGLLAPVPTIGYHALGMACLVVGSLAHTLLHGRRAVLDAVTDAGELNLIWICATAVAALLPIASASGNSAIIGIFSYFIFAPMLSLGAAVAHAVVATRGERLVTWRVAITSSSHFLYALSLGQKQVMGDLFLCAIVTLFAYGFKFRRRHVAAGAAAVLVGWFVIFPLAHIRASYAGGETIVERLTTMNEALQAVTAGDIGVDAIDDPNVRALVLMASAHYRYLDTTSTTLARVSLYPISDILIAHRAANGPIDADVYESGITILPRAITGIGADVNPSNLLGRLAGVLGPDDEQTGVSFGPFAENFSMFEDFEAVATTTLTWGVFAGVLAFLFGGLKNSIWACAAAIAVRHGVSECSSLMQVYSLTRTIPAILILAVGATIVRPLFTSRRAGATALASAAQAPAIRSRTRD